MQSLVFVEGLESRVGNSGEESVASRVKWVDHRKPISVRGVHQRNH